MRLKFSDFFLEYEKTNVYVLLVNFISKFHSLTPILPTNFKSFLRGPNTHVYHKFALNVKYQRLSTTFHFFTTKSLHNVICHILLHMRTLSM